MVETIKVRLLREPAPPSPDGSTVRFGLQDKKGAMHEGVGRADGLTQFDIELSVVEAPDGSPDFGGPFVSGSSTPTRRSSSIRRASRCACRRP